MTYLDANIFLRAIVEPITETQKAERAAAVALLGPASVSKFTCSEVVIHETLYQLTNKVERNGYGLSPVDACDRLRVFLTLPRFQHFNKRAILNALDIWSEFPHLGFSDAYSLALIRGEEWTIATFDPHFDNFPDIDRYNDAA